MSTLTTGWTPTVLRGNADSGANWPLVLAHRGSPSLDRPENTVAAVTAALAAGAGGIEIDVRLAADASLVCSHDADLARLTGVEMPIAEHDIAALRRVPLLGGHCVAVLDDVLHAAAGYGRRRVVIEAKATPDAARHGRMARALAAVVVNHLDVLDLTVSSFDPSLLAAVRPAMAGVGVRTALIGSSFDRPADLLRRAVADGHDEVHPNVFSLLRTPAVVDAARSLGVGVTCWTVNRPRHVARMAELGVDAVITDDVAGLRAALRYRPGSDRRPPLETANCHASRL